MSTPTADSAADSAAVPTPDSTCPRCGNEEVLIRLNVDGSHLVMHACATCDTRRWQRDGDAVALDGVLTDLSSVPTRYRRSLSG